MGVLNQAKVAGKFQNNPDKIPFSEDAPHEFTISAFDDYMKSAPKTAARNAKPVLSADDRLNRQLTDIDKQVERLRRNNPQDTQQINQLLTQKTNLIAERKEQLLDAYAAGTIPKEYVDSRNKRKWRHSKTLFNTKTTAW